MMKNGEMIDAAKLVYSKIHTKSFHTSKTSTPAVTLAPPWLLVYIHLLTMESETKWEHSREADGRNGMLPYAFILMNHHHREIIAAKMDLVFATCKSNSIMYKFFAGI